MWVDLRVTWPAAPLKRSVSAEAATISTPTSAPSRAVAMLEGPGHSAGRRDVALLRQFGTGFRPEHRGDGISTALGKQVRASPRRTRSDSQ
jgi:hypothetical protein